MESTILGLLGGLVGLWVLVLIGQLVFGDSKERYEVMPVVLFTCFIAFLFIMWCL
jgi:hypothetical protein